MSAPTDPVSRRPPAAALCAAALALPCAFVLVVLSSVALVVADGRNGGGAFGVLLAAAAWVVGLLAGALRLLLGRSWLGLAVTAGALTALLIGSMLRGGLGGGSHGFGTISLLVATAATVLAVLPVTRRWVAARQRERRSPGSAQRLSSRL